jgi:hypothetical protein
MTVMTTLMPGAKLPAFYVQVKVKSNHLSRETTPPQKKKTDKETLKITLNLQITEKETEVQGLCFSRATPSWGFVSSPKPLSFSYCLTTLDAKLKEILNPEKYTKRTPE